ncbi:MAG: ATP synthase F0 subunit B [Deltaproteobacteria bacterium]|nr:ATP synthase F0 subunit B [Deltaproteobacteria bacterium]
MLSIDITLIYQVVGFFVLLFILNRLLYIPLQGVLEERKRRIGGALEDAESIEADLEGKLAEYDKRIQEAKLKAQEERARIRQEGVDREREITEEVRGATTQEMERVKGEIARGTQDAIARLKDESSGFARTIAEKIVGRTVASFLIMVGIPLLTTVVATAAFGADGGGHGGEHGAEEGGSTWKIINFVILVVGIYIVWIKFIKGMLAERRDGIRKAMDEAKVARESAEQKSAEYDGKLKLLDSRVAEITRELREEGEGERVRIIAEAERGAEKIKEQARVSAEQEIKKANEYIKREVARLAVGMAGEVLKREVKPSDQERLIDESLKTISLQ